MRRKTICSVFCFLLVIGMADSARSDLLSDPSLVIYYSFDEVTDIVADQSGHGYDGVVNGDITADPGGVRNGAAKFTTGSYLDLDGPSIAPEHIPTSGMTLAAWIKCENTGGHHAIFNARASDSTWLVHPEARSNGEFRWLLRTDGGTTIFDIRAGSVTWDEWLHFAGVYDKASGKAFLYINGELVREENITNAPDIAGDWGQGARVGYNIDNARPFTGLMDMFWMFGRALSQAEIEKAMQGEAYAFALSPKPADGEIFPDVWANISWSPGDFAVSHDVYFGDDFDLVSEGAAETFQGNQTVTYLVVGFPGFPYPDGLVPGTTYYWRIDEVNDADPNSPWIGPVWSFSVPPKTAYHPDPADGAEFVDPNADFSWTVGFGAKLHTVYFGDDFDTVNNATGGSQQGTTTYVPGPLESEKVYYWRVDEFDASETHKGDVWGFTTPGAVGNPQPANGAADVQMIETLSWTAADNAASHELYFGTDAEAVRNAETSSPEYVGPRALGSESYDPGGLAWDSSYAWRVDEVYPNGTVKGLVWTFATADFIVVDDFESYDDIDPLPDETGTNRIFDKWIDGFGTTTNGALVGNDMPPYAEQKIVHGGAQSMPYVYDNDGKTSEATLTLVYPRDWTTEGVTKLSLWFRGDAANAA
ncbi:MAG: LamG domain-containing protein, partial [Planctomycetota bacterium]